MRGSRLRQMFGGGALIALLLWWGSSVSLAAAGDCDLAVSPASGPPGTMFVFSGSGYSPTELRLTRDGSEPRVVPLSLGGADPFEFNIVAGDGDVGKWKAIAVDSTKGCQGGTVIKVTLPGTYTLGESIVADKAPVVAAFAGLAGVFVLSAAFLLRRSRRTF